jgi:hypothetical protein
MPKALGNFCCTFGQKSWKLLMVFGPETAPFCQKNNALGGNKKEPKAKQTILVQPGDLGE